MGFISFIILLTVSLNSFAISKIAIIDTGVDINNFSSKKLVYSDYSKCHYNFNVESSSPCIQKDMEDHGNIVFNIIGKNAPNNSILSYIYFSPDGYMKDLSYYKYPGSLREVYVKKQIIKKISSNIAKSIDMAIANKAKVINISLGDRGLDSDELKDSIENNPEVLFVIAAGNYGNDMNIPHNKTYPCAYKYSNTICVGSLNKEGKIAEYSNYGQDVDVYIEPLIDEGTSFSTPLITKEAYQLLKNKNISQVVNIIKSKYKKPMK